MTIPEFGIVFAIVCIAVLVGWSAGWKGGYDAGLVEQEERWADVDEARLQEAEAE